MKSKFFLYRIESFVLLILFIGAFVLTICSGNVVWFVMSWFVSGVGAFQLSRLRCPKCGEPIMRRKFRYFYLPRQFFPKKCGSCDFDLTKM
jgi:hypothetical protein